MRPAPLVTIVMYHFVRRTKGTRFARLAALDPARFVEQLTYVLQHYTIVPLAEVVAAAEGATTLPPHPAVLTFDDGYREHYTTVFPLLAERRLPATFFVARSALVDRTVLATNKVQLILAAAGSAEPLAAEVDAAVERSTDAAMASVAEYRARWARASRFDPPIVVYVKRMLQHGLPEGVRAPLVDALFRRYVTTDEAAFARELYLEIEEAREMREAGMAFGGHGDRHIPLTALDRAGQSAEVDGALAALDAIGAPRQRFAFSYVKGEHDASSIELLRERGCAAAVTTRPDLAHASVDGLLTLPRLDTNDLPTDGAAPPNAWTERAHRAREQS